MPKISLVSFATGLLLSSTALSADLATIEAQMTPAESPAHSGIVSLWLGGAFLDSDDGDFDEDAIFTGGGRGRGYVEIQPDLGLQLEVFGNYDGNADADDDDEASVMVLGAGHLIMRRDASAWGVFVGASHTQYNDTGDTGEHILGGVEAAWFTGMNAFYGQLGALTVIGGSDENGTWDNGVFGKIGARHFFSDTSKLEGHVALGGFGDMEDADSGIWGQWGLEYERQFNGSPLSWFVAYQGDYLDDTSDGDDDHLLMNAFKVGLKAFIGAGDTLYSINHNGAGTFSVPDLHVPFGYVDDLF